MFFFLIKIKTDYRMFELLKDYEDREKENIGGYVRTKVLRD